MTTPDLNFDGKRFIPTKEAVRLSGYSADYVGQLCRGGKLDCRMIGRLWYVAEESLNNHLKLQETLSALRHPGVERPNADVAEVPTASVPPEVAISPSVSYSPFPKGSTPEEGGISKSSDLEDSATSFRKGGINAMYRQVWKVTFGRVVVVSSLLYTFGGCRKVK